MTITRVGSLYNYIFSFLHHQRTTVDVTYLEDVKILLEYPRTQLSSTIALLSTELHSNLARLGEKLSTDPAPAVCCSLCYPTDTLVSNNTTQAPGFQTKTIFHSLMDILYNFWRLFSHANIPLKWWNRHLFSATITFEWDFGQFWILGFWRSFLVDFRRKKQIYKMVLQSMKYEVISLKIGVWANHIQSRRDQLKVFGI